MVGWIPFSFEQGQNVVSYAEKDFPKTKNMLAKQIVNARKAKDERA